MGTISINNRLVYRGLVLRPPDMQDDFMPAIEDCLACGREARLNFYVPGFDEWSRGEEVALDLLRQGVLSSGSMTHYDCEWSRWAIRQRIKAAAKNLEDKRRHSRWV